MSAKITIRESNGTEYQLKKRIAEMVLKAGYSRKVERGLHEMIAVTLGYALKVVTLAADTRTKAWGNPDPQCSLATYPVKDQTSNPKQFGAGQDWLSYPETPGPLVWQLKTQGAANV